MVSNRFSPKVSHWPDPPQEWLEKEDPFEGSEVSTTVLATWINTARRENVPLEALFRGVDREIDQLLDPKARVTWEELNITLENVTHLWTSEEIDFIQLKSLNVVWPRPMLRAAKLLYSPVDLFLWAGNPQNSVQAQLVSCMTYECKAIGSNQIEMWTDFKPGKVPSPAYARTAMNYFCGVPTLFGWEPARVEIQQVGNRMHANFYIHEEVGWLKRLWRLATSGVTALDIARELQEAHNQEAMRYEQLQLEMAERKATASELEAKNAEMERFVYTVSHDLKSPLVTIHGFLGLLEKDLQNNRIDRVHSDVDRIRSAVDQMASLLQGLLELSRVGRVVGEREEFSLDEAAKEALKIIGERLEKCGGQIDIADDMPQIFADRLRIVEIFQNLIENAINYSRANEPVQIRVSAKIDEGFVECIVTDNGIGIEPRFHEEVFELFARLDAESSGTGVGLSIVKRVIEFHGGRIWVESAGADAGSQFHFVLPEPPRGGIVPKEQRRTLHPVLETEIIGDFSEWFLKPDPLAGSEVSCRAIVGWMDACLTQGKDLAVLLGGVDRELEHLLDPEQRISWVEYKTILQNTARLWSKEEERAILESMPQMNWLRSLTLAARVLFMPSDFFMWIGSGRQPIQRHLMSCFQYTCERMGSGHVVMWVDFKEGIESFPEFEFGVETIFSVLPTVLGWNRADVRVANVPPRLRIDVYIEEKIGWLHRLRRLFSWPGTAREVAQELQESYSREELRYANLMRESEEHKRAVAELESSNKELEYFVYATSHDLKAPLVTMSGFLGLMEQGLEVARPEEVMADVVQIQAAADQLGYLLGDLLEFSRIGRMVTPMEHFDLGNAAAHALRPLKERLEQAGCEVESPEQIAEFFGERLRIVEVFRRLFENALDFSSPKRPVQIRVTSLDHKDEVECIVHDNGIGIEKQYFETIFGLFNRLDATSAGTGMGLALVKRIVEFHGGRVWVNSEGEDQGCSFHFTLSKKLCDES